jgi:hypothetical protein
MINWSHYGQRTESQKKKFVWKQRFRRAGFPSSDFLFEGKEHTFQLERDMLQMNAKYESVNNPVNVLSFHRRTRLPLNYLHDFPDV